MNGPKAPRQGRVEDYRLTTGQGRYTDDLAVEGALWVVFVRSPYGAASIGAIDTEDAAQMPGVVAIYTGADLEADGVGPVQAAMALEGPDGKKWEHTLRPLLAVGEARFVGEPIAMVIAKSRMEALDAAEAVMPDLEDHEAIVTIDDACADGARLVHADRPGNIGAQWSRGDWDKAGAALAASDHRVKLRAPISRVAAVTMEPRWPARNPAGAMGFMPATRTRPRCVARWPGPLTWNPHKSVWWAVMSAGPSG